MEGVKNSTCVFIFILWVATGIFLQCAVVSDDPEESPGQKTMWMKKGEEGQRVRETNDRNGGELHTNF